MWAHLSGMPGIAAAYILCLPGNAILENLTGLAGVAQLDVAFWALGLAVLSTVDGTMLGGFVPALIAANKDAVAGTSAQLNKPVLRKNRKNGYKTAFSALPQKYASMQTVDKHGRSVLL